MKALLEAAALEGRTMRGPASHWPNEAVAANALEGLAAEARRILGRIDEVRSRASKDGADEEMSILRALPKGGGWTDIMELPSAGLSGRNVLRSRVLRMAREGLLEVHRNETYPNMMSVRLGSAGRTALRRHAAREAMAILTAPGGETYRDVVEARRALRRLADRIC